MTLLGRIVAFALLCAVLPTTGGAEKQHPAPDAPLPAQLSTARIIFLSNACEDDNKTCRNIYDQLYLGLTSNRFQLSGTPQNSDLIVELHFVLQSHNAWRTVRLLIIDPRTRATLWSIDEDAQHFDPSAAVQQALADLLTITQAPKQ